MAIEPVIAIPAARWLTVLGVSFVLYIFSTVAYRLWFSPLAKYPGPFLAKISDFWKSNQVLSGRQNEAMIDLHRRLGPIVRIGPRELSISDPELCKQIYNAKTPLAKAAYYDAFHNGKDFDLFGERNEHKHGQERRLVSRAYSIASLKMAEPRIDIAIQLFVDHLKAHNGEDIDFSKRLELFAMDCVCEATFSRNYGFLAAGTDGGLFGAVRDLTKAATLLGQTPAIFHFINPFIGLLGKWVDMNGPSDTIVGIIRAALAERKTRSDAPDKSGANLDIAGVLLANDKMLDHQREFILSANIVAGVGDMSVMLNALFYFLVQNPDKKAKLLAELRQMKADGNLHDIVQYDETEKSPYLQACMYEAIRLHLPQPGIMQREVRPEGMEAFGKHIPAGTTVGVNPWVIHRDATIFGDEVDSFIPERWLDDSRKTLMHRYFYGFGAGTRTCIGRNLAWIEASKTLATVLMHIGLDQSEKHPYWSTTTGGSVHQDQFYVKIKS